MKVQSESQQRPKTFYGVNMNFTESIFISRKFSFSMANTFSFITPFWKSAIDVVFVSINNCSFGNIDSDYRLNSLLFNIFKHSGKDIATSLNQTKYRRFFFFKCPASSCTFQSIPSSFTTFFLLNPVFLYVRQRYKLHHFPPHFLALELVLLALPLLEAELSFVVHHFHLIPTLWQFVD